MVPPDVVHHLQDVQLPLVALRQRLQDLVEPGGTEIRAGLSTPPPPSAAIAPTYFPRALKEWLKDLEATLSSVCRNTSTFRGLKLSPSSGRRAEGLSVGPTASGGVFGLTVVVVLVGVGQFFEDGQDLLVGRSVLDGVSHVGGDHVSRQRR